MSGVGTLDGTGVGWAEGRKVVGRGVGSPIVNVGFLVGKNDGWEGTNVGPSDGASVGDTLGLAVGFGEGIEMGNSVGRGVGLPGM